MIPLQGLLAVTSEDLSFWERVAEKWGIGFIGMGLFVGLAWWANKRDAKNQVARDARDDAMQKQNMELMKQIIDGSKEHSERLEEILVNNATERAALTQALKDNAKLARCRYSENQ